MKWISLCLAAVMLVTCHMAHADGFGRPVNRMTVQRMPKALFTTVGMQPAGPGEVAAPPATSGPIVQSSPSPSDYSGYPFVSGCNTGCDPCCDSVWAGYKRHCHVGHLHGFLHHCKGRLHSHCGAPCSSSCCDPCGGWGGGSSCFCGSFAGGCGGCGLFGGGLFGHHHWRHGSRCTYGPVCCTGTVNNGCGCGGGQVIHNGKPTMSAPAVPGEPTPAPQVDPAAAPTPEKSAFRPMPYRGYSAR